MYQPGTIIVCVETRGLEPYTPYFSSMPVKGAYYTVRYCRFDPFNGWWGILLNEIAAKMIFGPFRNTDLSFHEAYFRKAESSHSEITQLCQTNSHYCLH